MPNVGASSLKRHTLLGITYQRGMMKIFDDLNTISSLDSSYQLKANKETSGLNCTMDD